MTASVPAGPGDTLFPAATAADDAGPVRPAADEWARVNSARKCDVCTRELAAARGHAPLPSLARWRHRIPDGDELLCYPHAWDAREGAS
ncbi:hypothetical protein [Actinomadura terrae]|uniref:hypothetical protein n=1 Tax=Actinomadura terrae TaxID=604353 RepID=UPI001FA6E899|nr:hypothetical protein [Actinomadura terrae]